jgi:predicted ArsR family transcriptional regulator
MSDRHGNEMVSDEEILAAFDEIEGPFVTATELADQLPIGRFGVRKRLEDLHERGRIGRKQPIQQIIGWWKYEDDGDRRALADQLD